MGHCLSLGHTTTLLRNFSKLKSFSNVFVHCGGESQRKINPRKRKINSTSQLLLLAFCFK